MPNPLKQRADETDDGWIGKPPGMDTEDLRQWCADTNMRPFVIRAGWWYFVRKSDSGIHFVDKLEGWKAEEARSRAARQPVEWYRPTPEDAEAIHAFARRCMEQDWTQTELNEFVQRTGGCKRVVPPDELAV